MGIYTEHEQDETYTTPVLSLTRSYLYGKSPQPPGRCGTRVIEVAPSQTKSELSISRKKESLLICYASLGVVITGKSQKKPYYTGHLMH
jgi:hypothetical protein